jgi:hypothetical protein
MHLQSDLSLFGEFHRIADKVEENLPKANGISDDGIRNLVRNEAHQLQALSSGWLCKQVDGFFYGLPDSKLDSF